MSKKYGFYFESARCVKCYACEIACKQWHGIKANGVKLMRVAEVTTGEFPNVKRTFLSVFCRHCANPPCAGACPVEAIQQDQVTGIVHAEEEKCIGCLQCIEACPFGVPQLNEAGVIQFCDMCHDRLEKGNEPICVATCPTQALHFGTVEDISNLAVIKATKRLCEGRDECQLT